MPNRSGNKPAGAAMRVRSGIVGMVSAVYYL